MSYDPIEETTTAAVPETFTSGTRSLASLSREERESLNALSLEVYGKRLQWQKMMQKGQLKPTVSTDSSGKAISVMRMHHFTVEEIHKTMSQILTDRESAKKAAESTSAESV
jgi:hypothetical protein